MSNVVVVDRRLEPWRNCLVDGTVSHSGTTCLESHVNDPYSTSLHPGPAPHLSAVVRSAVAIHVSVACSPSARPCYRRKLLTPNCLAYLCHSRRHFRWGCHCYCRLPHLETEVVFSEDTPRTPTGTPPCQSSHMSPGCVLTLSAQRGVLVKKDKRLSTHAPEKLASSTSSSRTSSNAIASEKAQLAGVLPIAVAPPPPKMDNVRATVMAVKQTPPIVRPTSVHLRPPKPRTVACAEVRSPLADHLNNGLSYKSSTITCSSVYSTQSGEERQVRVPPSVILAALGPNMDRLSSVVEHALAPPGGSVEPISSFKPPGEVGQEPNRLSHISAGSLPLNVQAVDHASSVGLAYGGEEEQES